MLTNVQTMYILYIGDDNMEVVLQKWGNSDGIRIPSSILKSLDIHTNDILNIVQDENKIIITKSNRERRRRRSRRAEPPARHGRRVG